MRQFKMKQNLNRRDTWVIKPPFECTISKKEEKIRNFMTEYFL